MKKFNEFVTEMRNVETLEELESGADLFAYGVDKGYYTTSQIKEFNRVYWNMKDEMLCSEIYKESMDTNYLQTLRILKGASATTKMDKKATRDYIKKISKAIKNNKTA